jgi:hypothetical protein
MKVPPSGIAKEKITLTLDAEKLAWAARIVDLGRASQKAPQGRLMLLLDRRGIAKRWPFSASSHMSW